MFHSINISKSSRILLASVHFSFTGGHLRDRASQQCSAIRRQRAGRFGPKRLLLDSPSRRHPLHREAGKWLLVDSRLPVGHQCDAGSGDLQSPATGELTLPNEKSHCRRGHKYTERIARWRQQNGRWQRGCKICNAANERMKYRDWKLGHSNDANGKSSERIACGKDNPPERPAKQREGHRGETHPPVT